MTMTSPVPPIKPRRTITPAKPKRFKKRWLGVSAAIGGLAAFAAMPPSLTEVIAHNGGASIRIPLFESGLSCEAAPRELEAELAAITRSIDGRTGVAVRRIGCDWVVGKDLNHFFPQQSVSKLWVTLATLDAVDRREARLDEVLAIGPADLTLFHQPLRAQVLEQGSVRIPISQLIFDAVTRSDNTANDRLLNRVGGPTQIRRMLADKRLDGIRFGPGERLLQSGIAGMSWDASYSYGTAFHQARARVPMALRQAALTRYLADPIDGATPSGITQALALLAQGKLLSADATRFAMDTLAQTHSGPMRLKAGAPPDWRVYHKTGTGQVLGAINTGFNDVGILEAPDGARYAVAVMIGETRSQGRERMAMMQQVSAAVARHHSALTGVPLAAPVAAPTSGEETSDAG